MEYTSLQELFNNLLPVLKTKVNEMKLRGIDYINEKDIWEYLKIKWSKSLNLTFFDMVSDILNTSNDKFESYKKNLWKEDEKSLSSINDIQ